MNFKCKKLKLMVFMFVLIFGLGLSGQIFVQQRTVQGTLLAKCPASQNQLKIESKEYTNSIGMKFVRIEPGAFQMGFEGMALPESMLTKHGHFPNGDFDEHPRHKVTITKPFYMAVFQVTNKQYELFDPEHEKLRGMGGVSKQDNEAVVSVSWYEARAFAQWLSDKEGLPYRLPSEAEWEYACRAGSYTPFSTGVEVDQGQTDSDLTVGASLPNPWGLYDMHGNVEEWCMDWYGPYSSKDQKDPVGRETGDFKVTRGGSHSTEPYYLRSANRLGTMPEDKQWMIGFRLVIGQMPDGKALPKVESQRYQKNVRKKYVPTVKESNPDKPYFEGPRVFIKIPENSKGPLFDEHNHFVAVTDTPNGDLIAAWFTCEEEMGRELAVAASRFDAKKQIWQKASPFWDCPDRNDHGHAFFLDDDGTIFHFNGLALKYRNLAVIMRTSKDNAATWSKARIILPDHNQHGMVIESVFRAQNGHLVVPYDGRGGSILRMSADNGLSWYDPGGNIRGTHAGVAQVDDGSLIAFGRHGAIDGKMPISTSHDFGKTWTYKPSLFQPIHSGRRVALLKLQQGPLLLASFCQDMPVKDVNGETRLVTGLFAATSLDNGKSWPYVRLVSDDGPGRIIETLSGDLITLSAYNAEPVGYLTITQDKQGIVHLLSSRNHYSFNLKWLTTLPPKAPPLPPAPKSKQLRQKENLQYVYTPKVIPSEHNWNWRFNGQGFEPEQIINLTDDKIMEIETAEGQQFSFLTEKFPGFKEFDPEKGFTAEISAQIIKSPENDRGLDIELYDGAGSRYAITIKQNSIYRYKKSPMLGSGFLPFDKYESVAEKLDNTDKFHTFRLAVRTDRTVQLYRDGQLIGTFQFEYRTPRHAYLYLGAGPSTQAKVKYFSYDLNGAFQP